MTTTQLLLRDTPPSPTPPPPLRANPPKFAPMISRSQQEHKHSKSQSLIPKSTASLQGSTNKGTGGCISDGVRQKLLIYLMNKKRPAGSSLLRSASSLTCNSTTGQGAAGLGYGNHRQLEAGAYQSASPSSYSCNPLIVKKGAALARPPAASELSNGLKRCHSIKNLQHRRHPYKPEAKLHATNTNYSLVCDDEKDQERGILNRTSSFSENPLKEEGYKEQVPSSPSHLDIMCMTHSLSSDRLSMRKTFSDSDLKNKGGPPGVIKMGPASDAQNVCRCTKSKYPAQLSSPDQAMDLSIGPVRVDYGKQPNKMRSGIIVNNAFNNSCIGESMETDLSLELEIMKESSCKPNSAWQSLPNIPKGLVYDRRDGLNAMEDGGESVGEAKILKIKHHPYSIDCLVYDGQSSRGLRRNVPSTSPIQESMNVTPPPTLVCSQSNPNLAPTLPSYLLPQSSDVYQGAVPNYNYLGPSALATAYMIYCCSLTQGPPYPLLLPQFEHHPHQVLAGPSGLPFLQPQAGSFYPSLLGPLFYNPNDNNHHHQVGSSAHWFPSVETLDEGMKLYADAPPLTSPPKQGPLAHDLPVSPPSPQTKRWTEVGESGKDLRMDQDIVSSHKDEPSVFRNRGASTGGRIPYKPRYHRMFVLKAEAEAAAGTPFERTNSEPIPGPPVGVLNSTQDPAPMGCLKPQLSFPVVGRGGICAKSRLSHRQSISKPLKKCVSEMKLRPSHNHPAPHKSTFNVFNYSDDAGDERDNGVVEDKVGNKQRLKEAILQWVANKSPSTNVPLPTGRSLGKVASSRASASSKRLKRAKNIDIPEDQSLHMPRDSYSGLHEEVETEGSAKAPSSPNGPSFLQRREDAFGNVKQHISVLLRQGMAASSFSMENHASRMVSEIEAVNALASLSMTQSR